MLSWFSFLTCSYFSVSLAVSSSSPILGKQENGSLSVLASLVISSSLLALNTIHEPSNPQIYISGPDLTPELIETAVVILLFHRETYQTVLTK